MPVVHINSASAFEAEIKKGQLTVVDFYAVWCGPCKVISPYVEELSTQFAGVNFIKVDVDELESVAAECNITAMPTFQFYKDGVKIHEFRGANKQALLDAVNKLK